MIEYILVGFILLAALLIFKMVIQPMKVKAHYAR